MADSGNGSSIGNTGMVIVIIGAIFASVYMVGSGVAVEAETTRGQIASLSAKVDGLSAQLTAAQQAARAEAAAPAAAPAAEAEAAPAAAEPAADDEADDDGAEAAAE